MSLSEASPAAAVPKSVTFTEPSRASSTSRGVRLPWTSPARCAASSACATPIPMLIVWSTAEPLPGLHRLGEARPVDQLHRDVDRALVVAPVVDGDDARVVHRGGRARRLAELLDDRRVAGEVGPEHLEGDGPAQLEILGDVHPGGGPGGELAPQLVAATDRAASSGTCCATVVLRGPQSGVPRSRLDAGAARRERVERGEVVRRRHPGAGRGVRLHLLRPRRARDDRSDRGLRGEATDRDVEQREPALVARTSRARRRGRRSGRARCRGATRAGCPPVRAHPAGTCR